MHNLCRTNSDWELLHAGFENGVMDVRHGAESTGDTKEDHMIPKGVPAYVVWARRPRPHRKAPCWPHGVRAALLRGEAERGCRLARSGAMCSCRGLAGAPQDHDRVHTSTYYAIQRLE